MKKVKKKTKRKLGWPEWTLLGIVAVSTLTIIGALCTWLIDTPQEKAEKQMASLADDYYTEYLYPRLLGMMTQPVESLAEYAETGAPTTYLRQLLHYNNDSHRELEPVFEKVACDTNATSVKYYPVEPYGPRDYEVKTTWRCDEFE